MTIGIEGDVTKQMMPPQRQLIDDLAARFPACFSARAVAILEVFRPRRENGSNSRGRWIEGADKISVQLGLIDDEREQVHETQAPERLRVLSIQITGKIGRVTALFKPAARHRYDARV
jgi:hypothetical protein